MLWDRDDDYQSVADALSISLGAAKVAVFRLRKRYREIARKESMKHDTPSRGVIEAQVVDSVPVMDIFS